MQRVRTALLELAHTTPEIREVVVPLTRQAAGWSKLPKGWTQDSVNKFWGTLTGDAKHKVTKCIERMSDKFDDPGAFCASLADQIHGSTDWRKGPRKAAGSKETPMRLTSQSNQKTSGWSSRKDLHGNPNASFLEGVLSVMVSPIAPYIDKAFSLKGFSVWVSDKPVSGMNRGGANYVDQRGQVRLYRGSGWEVNQWKTLDRMGCLFDSFDKAKAVAVKFVEAYKASHSTEKSQAHLDAEKRLRGHDWAHDGRVAGDRKAGTYVTGTPYLGKDYKSKSEVIKAWNAYHDFVLQDVSSRWHGKPFNKEYADNQGWTVTLRFQKNQKYVVIPPSPGLSMTATRKMASPTVDLAITMKHVRKDPGDWNSHEDIKEIRGAASVREAVKEMEQVLKRWKPRDLGRIHGSNWEMERGVPVYTVEVDRSHSQGIPGVDTFVMDTYTVTLDFSSGHRPFSPELMKRVMVYLKTGKVPPSKGSSPSAREITVTYIGIDRTRKRSTFKTLQGAQKFAWKWVGETPEMGGGYAVSGDGVGRVTVQGATLQELFPKSGRYASRQKRAYFSVILAPGFTKWQSPNQHLSRGAFKSEREAHQWVAKNAPGEDYTVKEFDDPEVVEKQMIEVLRALIAAGEQGVRMDTLPSIGVRELLKEEVVEAERGRLYRRNPAFDRFVKTIRGYKLARRWMSRNA